MSDKPLRTIEIRAGWAARPDWTVQDAATRVAQSLQLIHTLFPEGTDAFRATDSAKQAFTVDDPHAADRLAPVIRASRNKNLFSDGDLFGDGVCRPTATGAPLSLKFTQVATGAGWSEGLATITGHPPLTAVVTDRPADLLTFMTGLAEVWQARNVWIDTPWIRQDWNAWDGDTPVYSWATWLDPSWATVDTTGLDVDVTDVAGGKLIVLRVDPATMLASRAREIGKATIRQLAARTVMADGKPLTEVNPYLRKALDEEEPA